MIFNSTARFTAYWLRNFNFCRLMSTQIIVDSSSRLEISIKLPFSVHLSHSDDGANKIIFDHANGVLFTKNANSVAIFSNAAVSSRNICANVKVPLHANVEVYSAGDITTGFYIGQKVSLKTTNGNITLNSLKANDLEVVTHTGNVLQNKNIDADYYKIKVLKKGDILLKGPTNSKNIDLEISGEGAIETKKLQGDCAKLETKNGDITVDACYVNHSKFEVIAGNMKLSNLHGSSKICHKRGKLYIRGLDGNFNIHLYNSKADVQIERIDEDSIINHTGLDDVTLRLSNEILENNIIQLSDNTEFKPGNGDLPRIKTNCKSLKIEKGSWTDLFTIKM